MATELSSLLQAQLNDFFYKDHKNNINKKEAIEYLAVLSIRGIVEHGDIKNCSRERLTELHKSACDAGLISEYSDLDYMVFLAEKKGIKRDNVKNINLDDSDRKYLAEKRQTHAKYVGWKHKPISRAMMDSIRDYLLPKEGVDRKKLISGEEYDRLKEHVDDMANMRSTHRSAHNYSVYLDEHSQATLTKMDEFMAVLALKGRVSRSDLRDSKPSQDCSVRLFNKLCDCAVLSGFITETGIFRPVVYGERFAAPSKQEELKHYFKGEKLVEPPPSDRFNAA